MNDIICRLDNIQKIYQDKVVFNQFSLEIKKGDFLCIAGPSGSGKSTLLNLIGMFEQPDHGTIELFGRPAPKISSRAGKELLRNKIFYIFQNYALIDDKSIRYNMSIPLLYSRLKKEAKLQAMKAALESVGLSLPLDKRIYQLSGGEQQRVAIARAFLRDFELILADEPTGSLDADNKKLIMDILKDFQQNGKTIIIVSHDQEIIDYCPKVVYLK